MKKAFVLFLLATFLLPGFSLAAGKLTVTQEAFYVRPFLSYHAGDIYAELANTGDRPILYNGGMIELFDADGNSIESNNIYSCYPPILGPGETGYIFNTTSVSEAVDKSFIDDYLLTTTSKGENEESVRYLPSNGSYGEVQRSKYSTEHRIFATVLNDTEETLEKVTVVIALYDDTDNLLYADKINPYNIGIPSGQSVVFHTSVDSRILDAWGSEGIEPVRVVSIAYSED